MSKPQTSQERYYDALLKAERAVKRRRKAAARRYIDAAAELAARRGQWRKVALLECALRALEGATQRA